MSNATACNCGCETQWLSRPELAARLGLTVSAMNQWASAGKGPNYATFGRATRYRLADVIAWENAQVRPPGRRNDGDDGDDGDDTNTDLAQLLIAALKPDGQAERLLQALIDSQTPIAKAG